MDSSEACPGNVPLGSPAATPDLAVRLGDDTCPSDDATVGAVLVVGGGVAGLQASLDLSAAGFRAYLLESSPAVGGRMSRLDKTFPTGDCATCILSPKLVECMRDQNVEVITSSELMALRGEPGHFVATVRQRPRYVDVHKCTACGDCTKACPVELSSDFDAGLGSRKAIDRVYAQAAPNAVVIAKRGRAPCSTACPIDTSVQAYVALVAAGKYRQAAEIIRSENPLADVCGRVCFHRCEAACNRGAVDAPIDIRSIKRFVLDRFPDTMPAIAAHSTGRSVAVVGSGPSGLSAAQVLARRGHRVTVLESLAVLGGMLAVGIPEFRLPSRILAEEIARIRALGVEFRTEVTVGDSLPVEQLLKSWDAVFLATGAHRSRKLEIPGEQGPGVIEGIDFLRGVALGVQGTLGARVVVVGGGNTAVDAARTAIRLGATEVRIVYRRSRTEMPADSDEVEATLSEGGRIDFMLAPLRVVREQGRVIALECQRTRLGEPDASGRRSPLPIEGSEHLIPADSIIAAVSQHAERKLAEALGLGTSRWGTIEVDRVTLATSRPSVFAGGDVVLGPSSVIEAIAQGKRAAEAIDGYLRAQPPSERLLKNRDRPNPLSGEELRRLRKQLGRRSRHLPREELVAQRVRDFREVISTYSEEQAQAEARRCLSCGACSECMECVKACKASAIDHQQTDRTLALEIGAVVLTPGLTAFDARRRPEFGFGAAANVLSSVGFERILSASGPTAGKVRRPSDGKAPRRIAFIQCVGSRDRDCDADYCSAVCCMATTKQAILAKEHEPGLEATVFFLDLRAMGKDFDRYYERARSLGVSYVRSFVSRVFELPHSKDLRLCHVGTDLSRVEQDFDLVVLSVGLGPDAATREQATRIGVEPDRFGFARTHELDPLATSRPGVFVGGAFQEPKDIPDTVVQASAAAARAMILLAKARGTRRITKEYPTERRVLGEAPRIGVFLCHCGSNIASVVNVPWVTQQVLGLPGVVLAEHDVYVCADDSQQRLRERISEHGLNRVVVASCTPRTHEPIFRDTLRQASLNPYLLEMVNIRDQCSWVHSAEPDAATRKAMDLLRMAVARARMLEPLDEDTVPVNAGALVLGGGIAGMTAALGLSDQGFSVHLVEELATLGGTALRIPTTLDGGDVTALVAESIRRVNESPLVTVHLGTRATKISGHVGAFHSTLTGPDRVTSEIEHGVVVVATGAVEHKPDSYEYGRDPRVVTQLELSSSIGQGGPVLPESPTIVMIQCVEQRDSDRPHCSRVCCSTAVKHALILCAKHPRASIYVLFREMRTYGLRETKYREAREKGVVFVRYDATNPPILSKTDRGLLVRFLEPALGRSFSVEPDLVVLASPVVPRGDRAVVSGLLRVPLNIDGFFVEAHPKLRPVDFATEGLFLCGMAHAPKHIGETIAQAYAVGARAAAILSKDRLPVSGQISWVDPEKCAACMTCVRVCPYLAPHVGHRGRAEIEPTVCMGCGSCASDCPAGAITLRHYAKSQVLAAIDGLFGGGFDAALPPVIPSNEQRPSP
jgi:heterodisulfide reductase subunit A-like polyferredoxin